MNDILDSLKPKPQVFRPESLGEYLALQLAKKLSDPDLVWKYRSLFDHHSLAEVSEAFSNVQGRALTGGELIRAFEEELSALTSKEDDDAL